MQGSERAIACRFSRWKGAPWAGAFLKGLTRLQTIRSGLGLASDTQKLRRHAAADQASCTWPRPATMLN